MRMENIGGRNPIISSPMKQTKIFVLVLLTALEVCFLPFSHATEKGGGLGEAASVVEKFCTADAQGARLSSKTSDQTRSLTTWEDEPGWDEVTIISGFKISKETYSKGKAQVTVIYDVVGKRVGKKVTFTLVPVDRQWKIESPQIEPHVIR